MPRSTISWSASAGSTAMLNANANAMSARIHVLPDFFVERLSPISRGRATVASRQRKKPSAPSDALGGSSISRLSVRERIRPQLEMRCQRLRSLAALDQPWRAVAIGCPQSTAFPAGIRIVDTPVEALGIEAERIRHADRHHLAVLIQRHEAVHQVGGRHRDVFAQPEGVVLVDPRIVARLGTVLADAFEAWTGVLIERPAFGAMIAGSLRAVERTFAFTTIEHAHVATCQRGPDAPLLIDIRAP